MDRFFAEIFLPAHPPETSVRSTTAMSATDLWPPAVLLRRADEVLARRAAANAARAVAEEQARRRQWEREDVDAARVLPRQRAG